MQVILGWHSPTCHAVVMQVILGWHLPTCHAVVMQVILGLGSGHLVYLEVGPGSIQQAGHLQLQAELACLDITPLGEDPDRAQIAVAGEAVKCCGGHYSVARSRPLLPSHSPVESKRWALACSAMKEWHARSEQPRCVVTLCAACACHAACLGHGMRPAARTALSCNVVQPSNNLLPAVLPVWTLACPAVT